MSDPRQFNYTVANKGLQVNVGTHFESEYTDAVCVSGVTTPIDLTSFIMTGTVKRKDGTIIVSLVETLDDQQTGLFRVDEVNGVFKLILNDVTTSLVTANDLGTYDIIFTDASSKKRIFLRGKIEFILTASS